MPRPQLLDGHRGPWPGDNPGGSVTSEVEVKLGPHPGGFQATAISMALSLDSLGTLTLGQDLPEDVPPPAGAEKRQTLSDNPDAHSPHPMRQSWEG